MSVNVKKRRRNTRSGYSDCPLRARARAAGLTIRFVLDGFLLGKLGGPRERFRTIEALVARLNELELHGQCSTGDR